MTESVRPAVPGDDLDPAQAARMRRLLFEHARADAAGREARRHHGRLAAAVIGSVSVVAIAAGALAVALGGVPWLSGPPVATQPVVTATPTPAPTPAPTSTPSPTPPASSTPPADAVPTEQQFRDAVIAAGFDCSSWQPTQIPTAIGGGWCLPATIGISFYADRAAADQVVASSEASAEPGRFLRGPTWLVFADAPDATGEELVAIQAILGGELTSAPSTSPIEFQGYDARQLWDRCVQEGRSSESGAEAIVGFDLRYFSTTPDGLVQVVVAWDTPAEPKPTGVVWVCHFTGDPADPTLEHFTAKDV
jgi:hypothetical protein